MNTFTTAFRGYFRGLQAGDVRTGEAMVPAVRRPGTQGATR